MLLVGHEVFIFGLFFHVTRIERGCTEDKLQLYKLIGDDVYPT